MICRACGLNHLPMLRCEVARRLARPVVVHAESCELPIDKSSEPVVVHKTKHGKYADAESRKAYRREWVKKKRASK